MNALNTVTLTFIFKQFSKTLKLEVNKYHSINSLKPIFSQILGYDIGNIRIAVSSKKSNMLISE
jgi:hypothetical protein